MAETAILLALAKIGHALAGEAQELVKALLVKEVQTLKELPGRVQLIEKELRMINSLLRQKGTRHSGNETVEEWIMLVRQLAYRVEDTMDEYCYQVTHLQEEGNIMKFFKGAQYIAAFRSIADEVTGIEDAIKQLSELRMKWLQPSGDFSDGSPHSGESSRSPEYSTPQGPRLIKEEDLVGIEKNRKLLSGWLNSDEPDRSTIAVWGLGGLGKSTLVTNVYEREKKNFKCHAWVSVSQTYNVDHLLRKMIQQFCKGRITLDKNIDTMDSYGLKETLRSVLKDNKYMLILDDVWTARAFNDMQDALVDDQNGSRIIITTRKADVAALAAEKHQLAIKPLDPSESFDLFCRKAFQNNETRECPSHLRDVAKKLVQRCHGLPLAIVSIGSLLAMRNQNKTVWEDMYNELQWRMHHSPDLDQVRSILRLSYNDLPRHLKNCFLYCGMFPEDHVLSSERLVKLWIAEGFVEQRGLGTTLEKVAEGYLTDLIRRSMLELVETDELGGVARCRMHDVVRELALSHAEEESFGVAGEHDGMAQMDADVRRLSVFRSSEEILSKNFLRLRTLIAPDVAESSVTSISSKSKYLTVLELQGSPLEEVPADIGNLFNLRYLGLRGTKVKTLPRSVERLSNLQTLDLKSTEIQALPHETTKLKKLRHIFADRFADKTRTNFRYFCGVAAPRGLWNLEELQTLETVEASKDLAEHLNKLTQLRSLWLDNVRGSHCAKLFASLSRMRFLSSVLVNAIDEHEILCFDDLEPSRQLQKLIVRGRLADGTWKSPVFSTHGGNLKYLALSWCQQKEDPIPSLSTNLSNLTFLSLHKVDCAEVLVLPDGCFPYLKTLFLREMHVVSQVQIEHGAIPSLEALYLMSLPKLKEIPQGVEFLPSLKKLWLLGLHQEFKALWEENNWQAKLQHIPELRT